MTTVYRFYQIGVDHVNEQVDTAPSVVEQMTTQSKLPLSVTHKELL